MQEIEVILASPRGFCAGVTRAIEIVECALAKYGAPVYVRHEIVHNKRVVDVLKEKGVVFVQSLDEIPDGSVTIFSAHGVSQHVEDEAKKRNLPVIDATCPLVSKVHISGKNHASQGNQVIVIGHSGHPEVEGTVGRIGGYVHVISNIDDVKNLKIGSDKPLAYVTQTTLSLNDTAHIIESLHKKYPHIKGPDLKNICYATQNRQAAVDQLCQKVDALIILGAKNSSNSNRLRDMAKKYNIPGYLIDDASQLHLDMISNVKKLGISAGASAPEILIDELLELLKKHAKLNISFEESSKENIIFKRPSSLKDVKLEKKSF